MADKLKRVNCVCLIEGQVKLIPYGPEHDRKTVEWLNDRSLGKTFGLNQPVTLESHRRWLENSPDTLIWAIVDQNQLHQGNVLLHCTLRHLSAYFQIYLGDYSARGRGIGSTALRSVLNYAFVDLNLHRVWLHVLPDNLRAQHIYRRAGFAPEGTERDAILRDGIFHSQARWSLLRHEWDASKT